MARIFVKQSHDHDVELQEVFQRIGFLYVIPITSLSTIGGYLKCWARRFQYLQTIETFQTSLRKLFRVPPPCSTPASQIALTDIILSDEDFPMRPYLMRLIWRTERSFLKRV